MPATGGQVKCTCVCNDLGTTLETSALVCTTTWGPHWKQVHLCVQRLGDHIGNKCTCVYDDLGTTLETSAPVWQRLGDHIGNKCTCVCFYVLSFFLSGQGGEKTARWPTPLVIDQGIGFTDYHIYLRRVHIWASHRPGHWFMVH